MCRCLCPRLPPPRGLHSLRGVMAEPSRPTTNDDIGQPRSPVTAGETGGAPADQNAVPVEAGADDALASPASPALPEVPAAVRQMTREELYKALEEAASAQAPTPAAPPASAAPAGLPMVVTRTMQFKLKKLGYTEDDIEDMTPEDACGIIRESRQAPARAVVPQQTDLTSEGTAENRLRLYLRQFEKLLGRGHQERGAAQAAQARVRRTFGPLPIPRAESCDEASEDDPWANISTEELSRLAEDPGIEPFLTQVVWDSPDDRWLDGDEREVLIALLSPFVAPVTSPQFKWAGQPTRPLTEALVSLLSERLRREGVQPEVASDVARDAAESLPFGQKTSGPESGAIEEPGAPGVRHLNRSSSSVWSKFSMEDLARLLDDEVLGVSPLGRRFTILPSPNGY